MTTAAIVYRSHTGTTRRFAEEIGAHLRTRGVEAQVSSIGDCDMSQLANVDYLLLGCWTNGLFVVLQHPDEPWLAFARDLPPIARARVGLFTTYKLADRQHVPEDAGRARGQGAGDQPRAEVAEWSPLGARQAGTGPVRRHGV